ncbi:MAG: alpha/beta hydrolase [Sulfuriflexus sp.]|nr:alpha/beta hydrolase [Sulfuriflexus sp.]
MRNLLNFILFFYAALFLTGCSPLGILNATVSSDGYTSVLNQAYGKKTRQSLDVHIPNNVSDNADVVIFYYGGRWQYGSKEQYKFVADAFTSKGIIVVLPDYRLYPDVDWRDFIKDGAGAYQWVFENIGKYHGNPKRIFVMGHSAGAHISAMVSLDESLLDKKIRRPCGFMGLAGPYDFLPIRDADVIRVFSSAGDLKNTQPITFINKNDPAMLLMHGRDDVSVKVGNTTRVEKRVKQIGGTVNTKLYDDVDHIDLLISLSSTFRHISPVLDDSVAFMKKTNCN